MQKIRFIRALSVLAIHRQAKLVYFNQAKSLNGQTELQLSMRPKSGRLTVEHAADELVFPNSVFDNPMTLLPVSELNAWYRALVLRGGERAVFVLSQQVELEQLGLVGCWLLSSPDLASTIRRLNYAVGCLQSGGSLVGIQSGHILKWSYDNPYIAPDVRVHDGLRVMVYMLKVLRSYLGEGFAPLRVSISGIPLAGDDFRHYFGCEVHWQQARNEIWFHADLRLAHKEQPIRQRQRLSVTLSELDELLNMPDPDDELKTIYEMISYSCHFGLPTLGRVALLLELSEQQLQRRLQNFGFNFSTASGYVLSNMAVNLLDQNVPIETVAQRLGYTNVLSFNRMFRKHRGVTPKQYLSLHH